MKHFDVVVAGGGPAGAAAAIAAARNGSRTLLIEKEGYLGGMATGASVPAFCPFTDGETTLIGGIGMEILEALKKISYESPFYDRKPDRIEGTDWLPIDPEALKLVLDRMVADSGCQLLLHAVVTGCETEECGEEAACEDEAAREGAAACGGSGRRRVKNLSVFHKGGMEQIGADFFIDCTGDADVIAMAGGAFTYGDENGGVQAGTLCFRIGNFDTDRFMRYARETGENGNLRIASERARKDGRFPEGEEKVAGIALIAKNMASLNFGHVYGMNPLDGWDLTRAEVEARRKLPELMAFLREYVPGAEHAVLASSGPNMGIRESRRILGEYCLTAEDYASRADFADSIAYYAYPIDMHAARMEERAQMEDTYKTSKYRRGEAYGIPYRCLLPKNLENVLAAGRTISADRAMQASVRVMPPCFATGQAAGTAAALCVKEKTELRRMKVQRLRDTLEEQGACLRRNPGGPADLQSDEGKRI
ncbi:MAG: FAD-dependent oxidoreductase [Lachnospiraceae bacterium]|nr:FAD-dependent oxidoreductase [Lachnospiraceae bacterium]